MLHEITGDLLTTDAQYICHQCNCVSDGPAAGLAAALSKKYPYCDVYTGRVIRSTTEVRGDGSDESPFIIAMFAQYYPGPSKYDNDTVEMREKWFEQCLEEMRKTVNQTVHSVAFPWKIGCGLAGGNWNKYRLMIATFAAQITWADVFIIQREKDKLHTI